MMFYCTAEIVKSNVNGIIDLSKSFRSVFGVQPFIIHDFVEALIDAKKIKNINKEIVKKESNFVRKIFHLN